METKGAELVANIPFKGPLAALLIASFILSAVTSLLGTNVRSIKETLGVGTLIAVPSSFPYKLGNTKLIALAAPVEVGIMASPDALALLKSL